jgi:hypothetical protein
LGSIEKTEPETTSPMTPHRERAEVVDSSESSPEESPKVAQRYNFLLH